MYTAKSSPPMFVVPSGTRAASPSTEVTARAAIDAIFSGFTIGGVPPLSVVVAVTPYAEATAVTSCSSSRVSSVRACTVVARIVPVRRARSGMMLTGGARVDRPHRHDTRLRRIEAARHERLQRGDDRSRGDDRILRLVRTRAVRAGADDLDVERIGRSGERARLRDDLPDFEAPVHVPTEDRGDVRERAALDDRARAVAQLLGRLKHHEHVARGRVTREKHRRADGPRRVHVVTTRVHHASVLGRERQPRVLGDRERIDVAAHGDDRRLAIAPGHARNEPRASDARNVA